MKAVIIGATGATGSALLAALLAETRITAVTALIRRAPAVSHPKLRVVVVDFGQPEEWAAEVNGAIAFSCMGTTLKAAGTKKAQYKVDYEYQYAFAAAAAANSVPCFVLVSASTARSKSLVFYSRIKGDLEQAIRSLDFKSLLIFRPGMLDRPGTDRPMEKKIVSLIGFFNRLGWFKTMAPLPVDRLAALLLQYGLTGPAGTQVIGATRILEEAQVVKEA